MRLLFHLHKYPPLHNAGAEWSAHHLLLWMAARGHEVRVLARDVLAPYEFEGIRVETSRDARAAMDCYRWASTVLTHLDVTTIAMARARRAGLPLAHLVHNDKQLARAHVPTTQLAIFNSRWLIEASGWQGESMLLYPPCPPERYLPREGPHDRIVLVNLYAPKGAGLFGSLARSMPERRFLGVRGAYGVQTELPALPNLEVIGQDPDIGSIFARAALLLMPSTYESFGRLAVEAALAGVPTVAARTPGLWEAGVAVSYLPQGAGAPEWRERIEAVLPQARYLLAAARARALGLWSSCEAQLTALEERLVE